MQQLDIVESLDAEVKRTSLQQYEQLEVNLILDPGLKIWISCSSFTARRGSGANRIGSHNSKLAETAVDIVKHVRVYNLRLRPQPACGISTGTHEVW